MSSACKRILSSFSRRKKQKAWNKTREKYIREEGTQNFAERDRRSYYKQKEWLEAFSDNKSAFFDDTKSDDSDNDNEIIMKI